MTLAGWLEEQAAALAAVHAALMDRAQQARQVWADVPWNRDLRGELARNPGPYANAALQRDRGWWRRRLDQIDALTFHHTLSDSPHATARYYVVKEGGRPTLPYTVWVTQTGEVLLCVELEAGLWHDHTGHENTALSVGLAGSLHVHHPATVQLEAAARVAAWALRSEGLPGLRRLEQVRGHRDVIATVCPGWEAAASGRWKGELLDRIADLVDG